MRILRLWLGLIGLGIALAACGPTGKAIEQVRMGNTDERVQAARKLGDAGGEEAVTALVSALSDPVPEVQAAAAEALGKLITQARGDLWTDLQEGVVEGVSNATTLEHGLEAAVPDALVGLTLEFTSGPRKGERYQISANSATELTVAERVDFTEKGQDVNGSEFKIGRPVSEALVAALTGAQWKNEALLAYENTVDTGGETADIRLTLARLYEERGQKDKALKNLDDASKMAENADTYVQVAREFGKLGERDKALKSLDDIAEVPEENPNGYAYVDAAREYANLGEAKKARRMLAKAEELAATQSGLYAGMAGVYDQLGDKEKADAARKKAGPPTPGGGFSFPGGSFPGGTFQVQ